MCIVVVSFVHQLKNEANASSVELAGLVKPTQKLLGNLTASAYGINTLVGQENKAFASQEQYFDQLKTSTQQTFDDVHGHIIPDLDTVLVNTSSAVRDSTAHVDGVLGDTQTELEKAQGLTEALTARVNDPSYDLIVANASAAMFNLVSMTKNGNEAMVTVNKGVEYEYKQLTAPPKKIWILVKGIASVAGNFFHL
jgi:hypothetical protein